MDCPLAIIHLKTDDGFPEFVPGGDAFCMACGHCVAVCPHGALDNSAVPFDDCPPVEKDLVIDEKQADQFLRSRRSVRIFKDRTVPREVLQALIEKARYAPTGSNTQLVEWIVYTDPEEIRTFAELTVEWLRRTLEKNPGVAKTTPYMPLLVAAWDAGFDAILRKAPVLLLAHAPEQANNGLVDLTLALSYLELAALPLGLGTCWAGLVHSGMVYYQPLREAMGLPEGHPHHYPMMIGYPKFKYHRLPERKAPRITWR